MSERDCRLIILNENNYVIWKWQFVNILRKKKLMKVLEDENKDESMDANALTLLG